MSIINNSHAIGVDSRNLVLKTRGTLHVKVGDRYYELDFRNLMSNEEKKEEVEKEQYIITVDDKLSVENLEYPGDNKLIIGRNDKTLFVTAGGAYVDVSPEKIVSEPVVVPEDTVEAEKEPITELHNVTVTGTLSGPNGMEIDFDNNSISVDSMSVNHSFIYPRNTVTTFCGKTTASVSDYRNYDFLEIDNSLEEIKLKSGVMIKSLVDLSTTVIIGSTQEIVSFEKNSTYMVYTSGGSITYTKL